MQLFDCDDINITKIYHIEKYKHMHDAPTKEYGTNLYSYEWKCQDMCSQGKRKQK